MKGPYDGIVRDWHDGDTCHVDLDLGFANYLMSHDFDGKTVMLCRLTVADGTGVNAPELWTPEGKTAATRVNEICPPGSRVKVTSHHWDKYGGRFDGSIALPDGTDVAQRMVDSGNAIARSYP